MHCIIQSAGLTRRFGHLLAVDGLDLAVPSGCISAFLGPNGAGKTTAIRLLLGLLKPQGGTCEVLGYPPGHREALAQLGALVETPSLYPQLTGFENVEITRLLRNLPPSESSRVLSLVGLNASSGRQVQTYSLGMRQRLGLALALIGSPKLLILDEPTNGLDPSGIQEMRELICRLPKETGATIFLSSHLLAEVEHMADHLVVIHRGRLRYQGPIDDFGSGRDLHLRLRVGNEVRAGEVLSEAGFPSHMEGRFLDVQGGPEDAPRVASVLVSAGIPLFEMVPQQSTLEARFLALVSGE